MIKPTTLLPVLLLALAFCSCSKYSKLEKKQEKVQSGNERKKSAEESTLFFDAEKARLVGDAKLAYALYTTLVESYPENATARYNLARLQFQRQEIAAAEKNAQRAYEINPKNKHFTELYAELLFYQKKNKQAEGLLNALVQNDPDNEEYLYRLAMFHVKNKEYDKAVQSLNQLESKTGFNEDIIIERKNIYLKQGKTEQAIAEMKKLRESSPQTVQYPLMMIEIYENAGQKDKARMMYDELEINYSQDPVAQVELARYYFDQKNFTRSNQYMEKVMKNRNLDPETKIALLIPMLRNLENGSEEDKRLVVSMSKSIAEESPDNKDAVGLYAEVLYFMKNFDEALVQYRKALKLDASAFQPWNQMVTIYSERQQLDSALFYCNKSLEIFPNNPQPYFLKGLLYIQLKESGKAIKPFNQVLDLEPENPALVAQVYSLLGDAYHAEKNYPYSDSCYEKALTLQPDDASTMNNYAYYLSLRKEKLDVAERLSKRSLELMPDSKSFLDTYGWILYQQGKYTEAKVLIEKAVRLAGDDDGTLLDHLGDIYFRLNDAQKATQFWKQAKEKGADNPLLQKKINDGKIYE